MRGVGAAGATLTPSQTQIANMIVAAANQYGVPPQLALAVASHESGFNPNATNLNTNGTTDYGVMQLNTTTVQTLGVSNPLDPQQNISAGVQLLAKYYQQYGGNEESVLQAYAEGPGGVGTEDAGTSQFIQYVESYTPQPGINTGSMVASTSPPPFVGPIDPSLPGLDLTADTGIDTTDDGSGDSLDTTDNTGLYVAAAAVGILGLMLASR